MLIQQRRIRNLNRHLGFLQAGQQVVIGLGELDRHSQQLQRIGLAAPVQAGTSVLPAGVGPISRYNAEGRWIVHRERPKETVYRQIEWTRHEWRGRGKTEEVRDIRDVPYQRYPRTLAPPPSIELGVAKAATGALALVTPLRRYTSSEREQLTHQINLLLELFGECTLFTEQLEPLLRAPTRRLNWRLLPAGTRPGEVRRALRPVLDQMGPRTRPVAEHRLREVEKYDPQTVAVGQGGFQGYIVFGFPRLELFVLENLRLGNATYVLGENWAVISQLSKSQILEAGLQRERLLHTAGWEARLQRLLGPARSG